MKLDKLHKASLTEIATASNMMPLKSRTYYWKNFNTVKNQPPPPDADGPVSGGHYDALIKATQEKKNSSADHP
jgi:hypothetical protein